MSDKNVNRDFDPNIKEINGPTNVVRLVGNVNGIKKVLYLFMDWHMDLYEQTECSNIFSQDLHQYFVDTFYKLNKSDVIYDFFFEIHPTDTFMKDEDIPRHRYKEKYIWQVVKLFKKLFKYDKEKNKVSISDVFNNLRLHYFDIRDYFYYHLYMTLGEAFHLSFIFSQNLSSYTLEQILELLRSTRQNLDILITALSNKDSIEKIKQTTIKIKNLDVFDVETVNYLTDKIRNRYHDDNIKKILNGMIDDLVKELVDYTKFFDEIILEIDEYKNYIPQTFNRLMKDDLLPFKYHYGISGNDRRQISNRVIGGIEILNSNLLAIFVRFVDIFFMRRFLDKDYITNGIIYSGAAHSTHYIHTLVNYFDFEITHASYSAIPNIDDLMKEVKRVPMIELNMLFSRPYLHQCSDITNFPDNFL